ncbi:MAG: hypothetical protein IVW36_12245 [Dehalococcoidia bacterium]|nr:hypothetical protein [Dehalococcoidia bacterium]
MWSEPLTPTSTDEGPHTFATTVHDATGATIATASCTVNTEARSGFFGEMQLLNHAGGPKQIERALTLLVRASLAHAAALGIQHVHTRVPHRLLAFSRRACGRPALPLTAGGSLSLLHGDLADIHSHLLEHSDAHGHLA